MRLSLAVLLCAASSLAFAADLPAANYRVLAASRTSTLEKEMNEAASAGYSFVATMGGETSGAGKEAVVIMGKPAAVPPEAHFSYKLLATSKTSTMQRELQQLGDAGYLFRAHTAYESTFGGHEVVAILEKDPARPAARIEYLLLATTRTSTLQKEIDAAAAQGFTVAGFVLGKTAIGGPELIAVLKK